MQAPGSCLIPGVDRQSHQLGGGVTPNVHPEIGSGGSQPPDRIGSDLGVDGTRGPDNESKNQSQSLPDHGVSPCLLDISPPVKQTAL